MKIFPQQVEYVSCQMTPHADRSHRSCVEAFGVDWNEILQCVESDFATQQQLGFEQVTGESWLWCFVCNLCNGLFQAPRCLTRTGCRRLCTMGKSTETRTLAARCHLKTFSVFWPTTPTKLAGRNKGAECKSKSRARVWLTNLKTRVVNKSLFSGKTWLACCSLSAISAVWQMDVIRRLDKFNESVFYIFQRKEKKSAS